MDTSKLGMGVLINLLGGNEETIEALTAAEGRVITLVELVDNEIRVELDSGDTLVVTDEGQSCCEHRYITTDADLPSYVGKAIRGFRQSEYTGEDAEDDYNQHNIQSFLIDTTEGTIDFVTHVVHNGYYGGFSITARLKE